MRDGRRLHPAEPPAVAAAFALLVAWLLPFWSLFELHPDEGGNLATAALVAEGYQLYRDIWSDQPPLVTWLAAVPMWLAGPSMVAGRLLVLSFAVVLIGVLYALLARRYDRAPALFGVAIVTGTTHFVPLSASFMIGMVGVSLAAAALAAVLRAETQADRAGPWQALAGALVGLATTAKLFVLPIVGLLLLRAALRRRTRALAFVAGLAGVGGAVAWACGIEAGPQLVEPHRLAFAASGHDIDLRGRVLRHHASLLLVALAGGAIAWLACGAAVLALQRPFQFHHMTLLVVPAAWLAALAGRAALDRLERYPAPQRRIAIACTVLAVALFGAPRGRDRRRRCRPAGRARAHRRGPARPRRRQPVGPHRSAGVRAACRAPAAPRGRGALRQAHAPARRRRAGAVRRAAGALPAGTGAVPAAPLPGSPARPPRRDVRGTAADGRPGAALRRARRPAPRAGAGPGRLRRRHRPFRPGTHRLVPAL